MFNRRYLARLADVTVDFAGCNTSKKWRAVESGTFPLVDGAPARVGRLRGYGNTIVAQVAKAFIEAYIQCKQL